MNGTNKYFVIYKVTNKINSRFYIGMHTTNNPNDGYLGSGKRIKAEVKKYGRENFVKEILEYLPTKESLVIREKEIVNEDLLANVLCLNLKNGGEGGGKFWNEQHKADFLASSGKGGTKSWRQNILLTQTAEAKAKKTATKRANGTLVKNFTTIGFNFSEESKRKMSYSGSGSNNSQFGTCWVNDGMRAFKIKKESLSEYLIKGYSKGRSL